MTSDSGFGGVWTLSEKGFKVIRESLGPLEEVGFKSEALGHDLLSMAAMIGEWLIEKPIGVETFSEQQLRRYAAKFYPLWVPPSEIHRADGYWRLPNHGTPATIALEVERFRKDIKSYEMVADFYAEQKHIHRVIWISPVRKSNPIADRIENYSANDSQKHLFVDLDDFIKFGWQSIFRTGFDKDKTMSELMIALSSQSHHPCDSRLLLETKKKPIILSPNLISATHAFFN